MKNNFRNGRSLPRSLNFLKEWLDRYYDGHSIPGFSVGISHKGKCIFRHSWGYADVNRKIKLTPDHSFRMASHSKIFTSVAIMQLVEAEKLKLDQRVTEWLPWVGKNPKLINVTIRNLLSHSAGLVRDGIDRDFWILEKPFPTVNRLKRTIIDYGYVIDRDVELKYSNVGIAILGLVIEACTGVSYKDYITNSILNPLNLSKTKSDWEQTTVRDLACGYGLKDKNGKRKQLKNNIAMHTYAPAAGFISTLDDILAFGSSLQSKDLALLQLKSKREQRRKLLKAKHMTNRWYGLGLAARKCGKEWLYGHGGSFPGQQTQTWWHLKSQTVVTVMTNSIDAPADLIIDEIYSILFYFSKNDIGAVDHELSRLEGQYQSIWGTLWVLSFGTTLHLLNPLSERPTENAIRLVRKPKNRFQIMGVNPFDAPHEYVEFRSRGVGQKPSILLYAGTSYKRIR